MLYIIVTGGPLPDEAADLIRRYSVPSEDTVIIGCDGGCDFLAKHGLIPHMALGDMDSISEDGIRFSARSFPKKEPASAESIVKIFLVSLTILFFIIFKEI